MPKEPVCFCINIEHFAFLRYHKHNMRRQLNEGGELNVLLVPVILLALLFVGAGTFAVWAYNSSQDYKNNVDTKVAAAVSANTKSVQVADAEQYAEAAKKPLKTYTGPEQYGNLQVSYPKTWSGYVVNDNGGSNPLDAYFSPDVVPSVNNQTSVFALRAQITSRTYSQVLGQFNGALQQKKVTVTPYVLPKLPKIIGVRIDGQIAQGKQGSMIVLPLRDKTLLLWTESSSYLSDFNNNILPNITFSP